MKYQEFLQAYDVVFDETGYMNVESIKKIRNTINTIE